MSFMKRPNDVVSGVLTVVAAICLVVLCAMVLYGVVMRYVFDDAPDFVEPVALLMVIVIAFFGAALKVRDGGHIGLDSLVTKLPPRARLAAVAFQHLCLIAFAVAMFFGCQEMASTTSDDPIPIIGLPEATRYYIPMAASVCIVLFSFEHLLNMFARQRT
ncbi:TRAP transporter small permease [Paraburkholderia caballeronis]|uniref:TRAP transporter small permease protein n=1 Tax=Paraburkholderia caballeronis TaxID=416943 RepID=A0A1H7FN85_9BURK|nr:TRAP transporter small permease [Paraburkholderia caballeronis]PXW24906.1 TRAP-type C4-dicarboxylate transport system permease small subunit [Paraburkholderia caballeronis]PXX00636.1 TRAP-type C4-dicarboxylate transport system permease small subunit [Paraburkholderia caballeronis]RAJ98699.1 TRAP-type C4-dicarboxylate transport system permease small subunit [Paraburkholderia caballeronis]SEE70434.1 TRAP-type C4-dicarboxylate transport system, small permease component [Paraburkholderia caballe